MTVRKKNLARRPPVTSSKAGTSILPWFRLGNSFFSGFCGSGYFIAGTPWIYGSRWVQMQQGKIFFLINLLFYSLDKQSYRNMSLQLTPSLHGWSTEHGYVQLHEMFFGLTFPLTGIDVRTIHMWHGMTGPSVQEGGKKNGGVKRNDTHLIDILLLKNKIDYKIKKLPGGYG